MTIVDDFSRALIEAHRSRCRAEASSLPSPDYAQALEIQRRVQTHLGPVGGFKVARRSEGAPVIAPIPAGLVRPSGADVPVRDIMGIELEIGFELIAAPAPAMLRDPAAFFQPRAVLELVDTRLIGAGDDPLMKLADMQINDGLIVGPVLEGWDGRDFSTIPAALHCGDRQVIDGMATVPGGSALANLALFLASIGDHCGGLCQGQIVITGSLSGLDYFSADMDVMGQIEGFGEISCRLV